MKPFWTLVGKALAAIGAVTGAVVVIGLCACGPARKSRGPDPGRIADDDKTRSEEQPKLPEIPSPPLEILLHSPTGEVDHVSSVVVVFNQPMVKLSAKARRFPISIDPPVKASLRWVSGDTLKMELDERVRHGTVYTVRVPKGTRAISGMRLSGELVWTFKTLRPALVKAVLLPTIRFHQALVEPGDTVRLDFNQPVAPEKIERHVRLRVNGKRQRFEAWRPSRRESHQVMIRPRSAFPRAATVQLELLPGFVGVEGPLKALKGARQEYGSHLHADVSVNCDGVAGDDPGALCWPVNNRFHDGLRVRFLTPVDPRMVEKHVSVSPRVKLVPENEECRPREKQPGCASGFMVKGRLGMHTRYVVTVQPGIRDIFGQKIEAKRFSFKTRGLPPGLFLPGLEPDDDGAYLEQDGAEHLLEAGTPFLFKAVNLKEIWYRIGRLRGARLVRFLGCMHDLESRKEEKEDDGSMDKVELCLQRLKLPTASGRISVKAPRDRIVARRLPLLPRGDLGGVAAMVLASPQLHN